MARRLGDGAEEYIDLLLRLQKGEHIHLKPYSQEVGCHLNTALLRIDVLSTKVPLVKLYDGSYSLLEFAEDWQIDPEDENAPQDLERQRETN